MSGGLSGLGGSITSQLGAAAAACGEARPALCCHTASASSRGEAAAAEDAALHRGEGSCAVQMVCGVVEQLLSHELQTNQFGVFRACTFWQVRQMR